MGAIDQYLELWRNNRDLLESKSSEILNSHRQEAAESLLSRPLPGVKDENYSHTNLESILSPDFGINIGRVRISVNPDSYTTLTLPTNSRV